MGEAGGELKGEERRGKRGRASGRSAKRANGRQPLARNAISCRYFGSGLGGAFSLERCRQAPEKRAFNPLACATLDFPLLQGSQSLVVSTWTHTALLASRSRA
jgi:hypothetical protein